MSDQPTEVIGADRAAAAAVASPRRRRPRWLRVTLWILLPLLVLVALLVVADVVVRTIAEQRVASEIEKNLPDTVKADVSVHIGGVSVIQQYLSGSFESVELDAPHATVNGAPLSATIRATGVPADFSKPVQHATGTLTVSQDSLNRLITIPGSTGDITLGDGTIGYEGKIDLLGLPVGYTVNATPRAAGAQVLLQPGKASLTTGGGDVNLTRLLQALTDNGPFPVCAAQYLPDGVKVSDIQVTPKAATVTLTASDFVLDEAFLHSKGSCS